MKTLSEEELALAKTHLELVQAIRDDMSTRIEFAHTEEFLTSRTDIQQIAYLTITKSIGDILEAQVRTLSESLGVNVLDTTPEEQLAEVIQLFDGNRRQGRRV